MEDTEEIDAGATSDPDHIQLCELASRPTLDSRFRVWVTLSKAGYSKGWRRRETHCASSHNQNKDNTFKNKKQPELPENRTVWKPDNQGVKAETLTQTGR